jgi:hypothetical protein
VTDVELPEWTQNLTERDRVHLRNRLAQMEPEKRTEELETWLEFVTDPGYQMVRDVVHNHTRASLDAKPIVLPNIPCDDDRPLDDWAKRIGNEKNWGELFASVEAHQREDWEQTVRRFEANPNNVYNAWWFLNDHPAFWRFRGDGEETPAQRIHHKRLIRNDGMASAVTIDAHKVDPHTGHVEDEGARNTETQFWVEMGHWEWPTSKPVNPVDKRDSHFHDYKLDCGGATMDEAVIAAAVILHTAYGNDRRACDAPDGWHSPEQIREIAQWYDTHDVFGNQIEPAHPPYPEA